VRSLASYGAVVSSHSHGGACRDACSPEKAMREEGGEGMGKNLLELWISFP
jgi:hypothetical protein